MDPDVHNELAYDHNFIPHLDYFPRSEAIWVAGLGHLLGVGALAQAARTAEGLEVRQGGGATLAPRHHVVAMH